MPCTGLQLLPLSFEDIDQALAEAAKTNLSNKRGKKRQNATVTRLNPCLKTAVNDITAGDEPTSSTGESSDLRTGRWTPEEIAYCDKLIEHFSNGSLPIPEKLKLNDFLANMLKSKQSRLTKKMKNARFSAKQYARNRGSTLSLEEAREFSQLETDFFASMKCNMERSEIRFHMQKVWRELFSSFCLSVGQKMDIEAWLKSVEEVDRRASEAKNAARKARRKMMMGAALSGEPNDISVDSNVASEMHAPTFSAQNGDHVESTMVSDATSSSQGSSTKRQKLSMSSNELAATLKTASYGDRVIQYVQRRGLPFEHVDIWVPSYITNPMDISATRQDEVCRLCFAGCATSDTKIPPNGLQAIPMTTVEKFSMISFGVYSQKFSFVVGSGLPGRIYSSGVASWEQGIKSAPQGLFERVGGAQQWGIETVLGIPVASPTVGRVVVLFYSMHDRQRDPDLVNRMAEELTALLPSPRWKLVVEVGDGVPRHERQGPTPREDSRISELLSLIDANMPEDQHAPLASLLPGITSLRLLLLKRSRTREENESLDVALNTYESYKLEGRSSVEIVGLTSRTFMVLTRQPVPSFNLPSDRVQRSSENVENSPQQCQNILQEQSEVYEQADSERLPSENDASFGLGVVTTGSVPDRLTLNGAVAAQALQGSLPSRASIIGTEQGRQIGNQLDQAPMNGDVGGRNFTSFSIGETAEHFQQRRQDQGNLVLPPMQQFLATQWNGNLQDLGNLDTAVLNNLATSGAAGQLAALLQNGSKTFL